MFICVNAKRDGFKTSKFYLPMKRIAFFIVKLLLSIIVAFALAAGATWYAMRPNEYGGQIKNGEWTTDLTTGSNSAGLYQRARVAIYGLWAMSSSETIYFVANTDADGNALVGNCIYKIESAEPDARWWSLTVYKNFHLIPNERKVYSFSQTSIEREPDNSWRVFLSPEQQAKNWLPSGDGDAAGDFKLVFRAYNPGANFAAQAATIKLPKIIKEKCR